MSHNQTGQSGSNRSAKLLRADETRKQLELLVNKGFDPNCFDGIQLDRRETARFVAEKVRLLRIATNAAGLRNLTWLIENVFYESYSAAQSRASESINLAPTQTDLQ